MESIICFGVIVSVWIVLYIKSRLELKTVIAEYEKELKLCDLDLVEYYKQKNSEEV